MAVKRPQSQTRDSATYLEYLVLDVLERDMQKYSQTPTATLLLIIIHT